MNDGAFKLRDRLRQERDALIAKFNAGGSVDALLHGLARAADHLLREVAESSGITRRATLIAVGGYGRGELFPHSDVDLLILLKQAPNEADRATIETLVGLLWDLGLAPGHSVRTLDECHEEAGARRDRADVDARVPADRRLAAPLRDLLARGGRRRRPRGVLPGEGARAAAAPHEVQRDAVQPRAQRQGEPRRPARPPRRAVDRPRGRLRHPLVRARAPRTADRGRGEHHPAVGAPREGDPRAPAPRHRAPRGPAGVRRAERRRAAGGLPADGRQARERAADAALLPRGEGDHADEHRRAAEHRAADAPPRRRARRRDRRDVRGARRAARHRGRGGARARPERHPARLPAEGAAPGAQGHVAAADARAVARARDASTARTGATRATARPSSSCCKQPQGRAARAAPHEPAVGAGPLPAGVPPHRRADAARSVPRLHRRPAHPPGAAQPAPLLARRARARVPAVQPADRRLRQAVAAVHRGALPRHRQGARRRPQRARRARCASLLPGARARPARHRPRRVPRRSTT